MSELDLEQRHGVGRVGGVGGVELGVSVTLDEVCPWRGADLPGATEELLEIVVCGAAGGRSAY